MSGSGNWPFHRNGDETYEQFVERHRHDRETKPNGCSHCGNEDVPLKNYSRSYGGFVGAHWLCVLCEATMSAAREGAGGDADPVVADIARMLHVVMAKAVPTPMSDPDVAVALESFGKAARERQDAADTYDNADIGGDEVEAAIMERLDLAEEEDGRRGVELLAAIRKSVLR